MSNLLFLMLPEHGHLIPTFKLARDLCSAGHRVTYLTAPSLVSFVSTNGLPARPVPIARTKQPARYMRMFFFARSSLVPRHYDSTQLKQLVVELKPRLIVLDQLLASSWAGMLEKLGIRILYVDVCLPDEREGNLPPVTVNIIPGQTLRSRLLIQASWVRVFIRRWCNHLIFTPTDRRPRLSYSSRLQMILCSKALDFERPERGSRHYVGPCVDVQRAMTHFPWDALDGAAKLIYCSFGSQSHRYKNLTVLIRRIVAAVAMRSDEQLVLVVGDLPEPRHFAGRVVCVRSAPQLELLKRSSAAIVHGGLGGIKECILYGVPTVIFPLSYDQPGNAARVHFHGVGKRCTKKWPTAQEIRTLLDEALTSPVIRQRLAEMQRIFHREQRDLYGVRLIEACLEDRRPRPRPLDEFS